MQTLALPSGHETNFTGLGLVGVAGVFFGSYTGARRHRVGGRSGGDIGGAFGDGAAGPIVVKRRAFQRGV